MTRTKTHRYTPAILWAAVACGTWQPSARAYSLLCATLLPPVDEMTFAMPNAIAVCAEDFPVNADPSPVAADAHRSPIPFDAPQFLALTSGFERMMSMIKSPTLIDAGTQKDDVCCGVDAFSLAQNPAAIAENADWQLQHGHRYGDDLLERPKNIDRLRMVAGAGYIARILEPPIDASTFLMAYQSLGFY